MIRTSFQKLTKSKLAAYKTQVLGIQENGIWRKNQLPYPHILPIRHQRLNILPSIRDPFWHWMKGQGIKLHSDFHHLNSSQALCFNLFFPLLLDGEKHLSAVGDALGISPNFMRGAAFEFQPHEVEGTSFDFSIPRRCGGRVYFEIKYTETKFGAARADDRHLQKFKDIYAPRINGRFEQPYCEAEAFLAHYQIARNIWHLSETSDDVVVFLFPKASDALRRQEAILHDCATELFRSRVRVVYLEDLIRHLRRRDGQEDLQTSALTEFEDKYFPGLSSA